MDSQSSSQRPNIVVIMTDQQRADFFASEGFALDVMPFIDSLGARGMRFQNAYTPMPTCAPARCSMLTGRFPKATRVRENGGIQNIVRPDDILDLLRAQGYSLSLFGKNHTYRKREDFDVAAFYSHTGASGTERTPQEIEFDQWLQALNHGVSAQAAPFPLECQLPYRIVRDAMAYVDQQRATTTPFFLWLSFPEPHNPYQAPEPYFSLFPEAQMPAPLSDARDGAAKGPKWRWMQQLIEEKRPGYRED
jgi:arylsulfatase A-like enzyme